MILKKSGQPYLKLPIFLIAFLCVGVFVLLPATECLAYRSCDSDSDCDQGWECNNGKCEMVVREKRGYSAEVGVPGSRGYEKGDVINFSGDTSTIGNYIKAIYSYGIGIVGILAAVVLMIGGVIWLTAGGNANKVETAKQTIGGALTGLVLALTSYMLLYQINPDLVQFRVSNVAIVDSTTTPEWEMGEDCIPDGTKCARSKNDNPDNLPLCANCCDGKLHNSPEGTKCGPSPSEKAEGSQIGCCVTDLRDVEGCHEGITKEKCEEMDGTFTLGENQKCENDAKLFGTYMQCKPD